MSDLTLVSSSEFENFLSVERDWNSEISQKVPNSGTKFFEKKMGFYPQNLYDFCQCRNFFQIKDCSQTYSKFFKGKFVELSNLRRKFALPTNFDSSFTECLLSQQNSVSVEIVLWTFWLRKLSV